MLYTIIPQAKLPRNISGMFTYSGEDFYTAGDVVSIEFRKRAVLGLVVSETKERTPLSAIKPIREKVAAAPSHLLPLVQWMAEYYFASLAFVWDAISPAPVRKKISQPIAPIIPFFGTQNARFHSHSSKLPPNILDTSHSAITNTYQYDTASKHACYIKLISDTWGRGACAMLLAPTIADTASFVQFLPAQWQEHTVLFTSEVYKSKQRYWQAWERMLKTSIPLLVLGTRSVLFAPAHNLGLIIIDKAESDDYKQYDQNPRYDARAVARKVGELTGCKVRMFSDGVVIC